MGTACALGQGEEENATVPVKKSKRRAADLPIDARNT
jgi:hypothetical protein